MKVNSNKVLAGYEPAFLENWYRHNYFNNEVDISGSGAEEYTFENIKRIAQFDFNELDSYVIKDCETVGSFNIREVLANLFGAGDPSSVMVTNGSNEALQLVVRAILTSGDEIVTQGPCYHCHDKIAISMGCSVKKWELSSRNNFELEFCQLKKLITVSTKAIFLNFPHNPTGVSITQSMLDNIIDLAKKHDLYLVWDAAFQALVYDQAPLRDPVHNYDKAITVGTFSKAYGVPGLRFGWIISPPSVIASCIRQKDYGNLFVSPMTEFVAEKMLNKIDDLSRPLLEQALSNREVVNVWAKKSIHDIFWRQPDGGVCGLLRLPNNTDDIDFCEKLLEKAGVLLVPGSCFEMPGYVRLGFGGNANALKIGLARLDDFLGTYKCTPKLVKNNNRFVLTSVDQDRLQAVVDIALDDASDFNDQGFLKNLPVLACQLPARLVKFLNEFKYDPPSEGYCVISNFKVDESALSETPSHWQLTTNNDSCRDVVMAMCLCSAIVGDAFGWLTQQDGRIVHDVMPIKKYANEQLGSGSNQELAWHNEDAFHELRGDYIMLMCLRNPDAIPTTLSRPDFSKLTTKQIDILFEKHYTIRPDNSHKKEYAADESYLLEITDGLCDVDGAYKDMSIRDEAPDNIAVLFGSKDDPYLRIDPYFMSEPSCLEAKEALDTLIKLVEESLIDLVLNPGDCIIIDNYMTVHGRRSFQARYDGTDRWLKRINIIRDVRRCHSVVASKKSRIIY